MSAPVIIARFFADLNPAYPSKGQHRWAVFLHEGDKLSVVRSFRSRRSAERLACMLQVRHRLGVLGLA